MHKNVDNVDRLDNEIVAAELLKNQLINQFGEDEELIRDMIEGQTSLREMKEQVVADIGETKALIHGITEYQNKMKDRKARLAKRIDYMKGVLKVAMEVGELGSTIQFPTATLSRKNTPDKLDTEDEAEIPSEYWRAQEPELDRKLLTQALKDNETQFDEYVKTKLHREHDVSNLPKGKVEELREEIISGLTDDEVRKFLIPGARLVNDGPTIQIRWA